MGQGLPGGGPGRRRPAGQLGHGRDRSGVGGSLAIAPDGFAFWNVGRFMEVAVAEFDGGRRPVAWRGPNRTGDHAQNAADGCGVVDTLQLKDSGGLSRRALPQTHRIDSGLTGKEMGLH